MTSALHIRTTHSTNGRQPESRPSAIEPRNSLRVEESFPSGSASAFASFDFESFELVRSFVEHVVATNALAGVGFGGSTGHTIDWSALEASVADCNTVEQAIGRAVVIADQMSRGAFDYTQLPDSPASLKTEDPFFAFSMADVIPDFGDESRYRTRVARKMTRMFGTRSTPVS